MSWALAKDRSEGNPTGPPLKMTLWDKDAPLNTLQNLLALWMHCLYLFIATLRPARVPQGPTESEDSLWAPASQKQAGGEQAPPLDMCLSILKGGMAMESSHLLFASGKGEDGLISLGGSGLFLASQPSDLWQVLPHQRRGPFYHLWGHSCHKHQKLWDRG